MPSNLGYCAACRTWQPVTDGRLVWHDRKPSSPTIVPSRLRCAGSGDPPAAPPEDDPDE
ncbi:hypothetical protein [Haloechinothrix sp. LS1_15]|uniref:hypothetical protein n=1 Tax=Haloechinothrix sp. LS1_15 TaxID=2652248 RepID=UPI00294B35E1|nr:hypothetical protein [Haloechinothrix sp. LS1_15]